LFIIQSTTVPPPFCSRISDVVSTVWSLSAFDSALVPPGVVSVA
jgi:hypothetical protein